MREIVIDAEITGLEPLDGHRVVEIGAVELINRSPTGQTFHRYLNPERNMLQQRAGHRQLSAIVNIGVRFRTHIILFWGLVDVATWFMVIILGAIV
jgi:Exonuclease